MILYMQKKPVSVTSTAPVCHRAPSKFKKKHTGEDLLFISEQQSYELLPVVVQARSRADHKLTVKAVVLWVVSVEIVWDSLNIHWVQERDICGWQGCKNSYNVFKIRLPLNKPEIMKPSIKEVREWLMDGWTENWHFWSNSVHILLFMNNLARKLNVLHFYSNGIKMWKMDNFMVLLKTSQPEIPANSTFFFYWDILPDKHFLASVAVLQWRHTEPLNTSALESIENNNSGNSVRYMKFGTIIYVSISFNLTDFIDLWNTNPHFSWE